MKLIFFQKQKANSESGFTLLEVLIAITIFIFALVATMTAARSGLASAYESRDQVIAFYLAQEAVEQIRNVRDTNSLITTSGTPTHWLKGVAEFSTDPCYPNKKCLIDVVQNTVTVCSGSPCATKLRQDPVSKMYGYDGSWTSTNFSREVSIQTINVNEIAITVTVTWPKGTFDVKEIIFNWQT